MMSGELRITHRKEIVNMKEKFTVVYEDNGTDIFEGTQYECENYIEEVQVKQYGRNRNEFGIYPSK